MRIKFEVHSIKPMIKAIIHSFIVLNSRDVLFFIMIPLQFYYKVKQIFEAVEKVPRVIAIQTNQTHLIWISLSDVNIWDVYYVTIDRR